MATIYLYATGPNGPITVPVKRLDDVDIIAAIFHDDCNVRVGSSRRKALSLEKWRTARHGVFCHSVGSQE